VTLQQELWIESNAGGSREGDKGIEDGTRTSTCCVCHQDQSRWWVLQFGGRPAKTTTFCALGARPYEDQRMTMMKKKCLLRVRCLADVATQPQLATIPCFDVDRPRARGKRGGPRRGREKTTFTSQSRPYEEVRDYFRACSNILIFGVLRADLIAECFWFIYSVTLKFVRTWFVSSDGERSFIISAFR
jgi:hypothetical protein